jgi:hypothetical protein
MTAFFSGGRVPSSLRHTEKVAFFTRQRNGRHLMKCDYCGGSSIRVGGSLLLPHLAKYALAHDKHLSTFIKHDFHLEYFSKRHKRNEITE